VGEVITFNGKTTPRPLIGLELVGNYRNTARQGLGILRTIISDFAFPKATENITFE
jgi:hypothetical protein